MFRVARSEWKKVLFPILNLERGRERESERENDWKAEDHAPTSLLSSLSFFMLLHLITVSMYQLTTFFLFLFPFYHPHIFIWVIFFHVPAKYIDREIWNKPNILATFNIERRKRGKRREKRGWLSTTAQSNRKSMTKWNDFLLFLPFLVGFSVG